MKCASKRIDDLRESLYSWNDKSLGKSRKIALQTTFRGIKPEQSCRESTGGANRFMSGDNRKNLWLIFARYW